VHGHCSWRDSSKIRYSFLLGKTAPEKHREVPVVAEFGLACCEEWRENCVMWEISSMENTVGIIIERVHHPELGRFASEDEARKRATEVGDNYLPWSVE
jgi:hypothetical protein